MFDIDLLRTFLSVYRTGTLVGAAAALGKTPADVSVEVRSLERLAGERLFDVKSRGMWPTAACHVLHNRVAEHVDALVAIGTSTDAVAPPIDGRLKIGGPPELLSTLVVPSLSPLIKRGMSVSVRTGTSVDILSRLTAGEVDLVVSSLRPMNPSIEHEHLFYEKHVMIGTPQWAEDLVAGLSQDKVARIIAELPHIAVGESNKLVTNWWQSVFGAPLRSKPIVRVGDVRSAVDLVSAGLGITVVPRHVVARSLEHRELIELVPALEPPTNAIELVWRRSPVVSAALSEARNLLMSIAPAW